MYSRILTAAAVVVVSLATNAAAGEKPIQLERLVNEISVYQNVLDKGTLYGQTVQIISINRVRLGWWWQVEFTADFNYDYDIRRDWDHYIEIGVVKPITSKLSLNVQRVHGTFVNKPVNQFGFRLAL